MAVPTEIKLEDDFVRVHVIGPGFGESVLVTIGQKVAIGIDCCDSLVQERTTSVSYLEEQLAAIACDSHLFWLITHFHLDHFESFERVLDIMENRFESIVVPTGYTLDDFDKNKLYFETMHSMRGEIPSRLRAAIAVDQFEVIQDALSRKCFRFIVSDSSSRQNWINTHLILTNKKRIPLIVEYYGATYGDLRKLKGQAASKLIRAQEQDVKYVSKKKSRRATANHGSYIVRIKVGKFEGLFPGDAQTKRTEEVLLERNLSDAELFCLKVAHHGAKDGTSQRLLDLLGQTTAIKSERHALIAPFRLHNLPTDHVKNLLYKNGFNVSLCGDGSRSSIAQQIKAECSHIMEGSVFESAGYQEDIIVKEFKLS